MAAGKVSVAGGICRPSVAAAVVGRDDCVSFDDDDDDHSGTVKSYTEIQFVLVSYAVTKTMR